MTQQRDDLSVLDALLENSYGLPGPLRRLDGEYDLNFFVGAPGSNAHVLKVMRAGCDPSLIELQIAAMEHVTAKAPELPIPRVVPTLHGGLTSTVELDGTRRLAWVLTALPGQPFGSCRPHPADLLRSLGALLGSLDRALEGFQHPALRRGLKWNLLEPTWISTGFPLFANDRSEILTRILKRFLDLQPVLAGLPRQAIHNDINDYNILVGLTDRGTQVIEGVIDFGDMTQGPVVCELAIAAAYSILNAADPFDALCSIVAGFNGSRPLSPVDLELLFPLLLTRLAVSVVNSARMKAERPNDPYVSISEADAWRFLHRFASKSEHVISARLRDACGMPVAPNRKRILAWLSSHSESFAPAVDGIDGVSIGRYGEVRLKGSAQDADDADGVVSLGIDLYGDRARAVKASRAGTVVNITRKSDRCLDAVVIRHEIDAATPFFSRFSGLHVDRGLQPGSHLAAGQIIGETAGGGSSGTPLVLQLSVAELALDEGWPLDSGHGEGSFWQQLLINPAPLLKLPNDGLETGFTSLARNLARRRKLLGSNVRLFSYKEPIQMARGWRHHLFDTQGRRFLDAYNNVPHVGHCHPRIIAAAVRQMQALNTNTRYLHEAPLDYAESLTALLPEPLRVCFFVNSGSEANELAIRLARAFTGARDMLVMEQGYHGNTNAAIEMSEYKFGGPGGTGQADWVHLVPLADPYRGTFRGSEPAVGTLYADALRVQLAELDARKRRIAGFICETLPSVGGQIVFPSGYLKQAYAAVRAAGGVCIADEVQTGLGRLGTHFWGFAAQESVPDIVVMGKPLGNGHPMAAVVTTAEIAAAFDNGMEFFSTFGGNTVSATIGLEVLRIIDEERLQAHAHSTGERLKRGLQQLCETHAVIGDVRGLGLFLGMELVSNRTQRTPATDIVRYVVNRLRQEQILVGTEGRFDSVIKIRPPLTFDDRASDRLVEVLDGVLGEDFVRRGCC